jgi:hypothetical protein
MDQNPENQNIPQEPLFADTPAPEPIPDPSPSATTSKETVVSAAQQVIDVAPAAVEEPTWVMTGTSPEPSAPPEPPLKPEILGSSTQPPKKNSNGWVIALIVLLVLCCCCVVILVPLLFLSNVIFPILGSLYQAVIDVLNNIFNGSVRFY